MKKILVFLISFITTISVSGATASFNITAAATTNNVLSAAALVQGATFVNAETNAVTVTIYDAPGYSATYTNAAYVTRGWTSSNLVSTITNILGVVQTWTNSVVVQTSTTNAANTAAVYRVLATLSVPASTTTVWEPVSPLYAGYGLLLTNGAAVSGTISYSPTR